MNIRFLGFLLALLALCLVALASRLSAQSAACPGAVIVTPAGAGTLATCAAAPPTPTPSPPPTAAPTAPPTAPPTLAPGAAPYGPTSPWNLRVSANPTVASYSARVISGQFGNGNTQPVRNQEAGPYDYGHPVFFATATDPLVTLVCTLYCSPGRPVNARIPAKARPAGGTDHHLVVVQPDGTEVDLWALTGTPGRDWQTGDTATAGNVAACGSYASGSGFATMIGATAGQACGGAGIITAADLLAGKINHALFLITQCAVGTQYPTPSGSGTDQCTSGVGPPLGGRLWYDQVAPTNLSLWQQAILNALHTYGGYLMDDASGGAAVSGVSFLMQSGQQTFSYGVPNPFAALAAQGWTSINIPGASELRWVGSDPWNPAAAGFAAHFHWLDPCSARGAC